MSVEAFWRLDEALGGGFSGAWRWHEPCNRKGMESVEPSSISPLLGTEVRRPADLLTAPVSREEKRDCARRWMRAVWPYTLVPAPLVSLNAWGVLLEAWRTQRTLAAWSRQEARARKR